MNKEGRSILGQWRNNRLYFSDHEKKIIIEDYLSGMRPSNQFIAAILDIGLRMVKLRCGCGSLALRTSL